MSQVMPQALVFTDLDATLLDHDTYRWDAAIPALNALQQLDIPVIFNTSKTEEECRRLQGEIGLNAPFIVENGSCVHWPDKDGLEATHTALGAPRAEIQAALADWQAEHDWPFQSFSALGVEGIAAATGLSLEAAALAADRAWSEPLLWQGDDAQRHAFAQHVESQGYRCLIGGRFVHVLGKTDKGQALRAVAAQVAASSQAPVPVTVALGDSPNDIAMLQAADIAVRIRRSGGQLPELGDHRYTLTPDLHGPAGWNQAMLGLIRAGFYNDEHTE